jgi:hypothetical protein
VTDSLDDLPLLAECARPLRTIWPGARFRRALSRVYLPGDYVAQVKRPNERYIMHVIIKEDLVFWVLSSVWIASHPLRHTLGLILLLASFWTIYERGYVDNDWAAAYLEHDGKLSDNFWHSPVATPAIQPWAWALALGAIAVGLLEWPGPVLGPFLKWLAVLVSTYWTFKLYNRIDKSARAWLYSALQVARSAALLPLVPVPIVGAAGLAALAIARWVSYYVYRVRGEWTQLDDFLMRLPIFLVLTAILGCAEGAGALLNWTAASLLLWNMIRARKKLIPALGHVRLLARRPLHQDLRPSSPDSLLPKL